MFRLSAFLLAVTCALALTACGDLGGAPRRNVLFIAVDDLRDLLDEGDDTVHMPNIRRLARQGRRFRYSYAQVPMCSPSRASVMSGWRPEKMGFLGNFDPIREHLPGAVPLQEHFRANGYFTGRVGKIYHARYRHQFQWDFEEDPGRVAPDELSEEESGRWGPSGADAEETDARTARRLIELLEERQNEPFFIAGGFISPHLPLHAPREYFDLYPLESVDHPEENPDDRADIPRVALSPGANLRVPRGEGVAVRAAYYACVSFLDAQIGLLLEAMDRLALWENTVVVFWSDHGFHLGEHGGLWRKATLFEESNRVPLIIVTPGMDQPGVASSRITDLIDIYPTLVDLTGLPPVEGLDGDSLVPLLEDPNAVVEEVAYSVVQRLNEVGRSIRTDRFRYNLWPDGSAELFDHWSDPSEEINLAGYPSYVKVAGELKTSIQRHHSRIDRARP